MSRFVKQIFVSGMMFVGYNLSSLNPLECVSMNNQKCKEDQRLLMFIVTSLYFFLTVLKQVNAAIVVIASMIPMQNRVFLMLLRILISNYTIVFK